MAFSFLLSILFECFFLPHRFSCCHSTHIRNHLYLIHEPRAQALDVVFHSGIHASHASGYTSPDKNTRSYLLS
jgi:hypothetical protein